MVAESKPILNAPPTRNRLRTRSVLAIGAGNVLEWYDFAAYASLASLIGKLFFPSSNSLISLLASYSTFAAGYLARPVGAAIFARIADSGGRKLTMILMVTLMGAATLLCGVIPTYALMGAAAPVLLVIARLLQGLSVGGEFSTSASYFIEIAPPRERGRYGSFAFLTANAGFVLGIGIVYALNTLLSASAMQTWGWRIPFLLSFPLLLIGMYLRSKIAETPAFTELRQDGKVAKSPFVDTVRSQWGSMIRLVGTGVAASTSSYTVLVFALSYLLTVKNEPPNQVFPSVLLATVIGTALIPVAGRISDRVGRRPLFFAGCAALIVLAFPAYLLLTTDGFVPMFLGQLLVWIPAALFLGVVPATFSEMFPTRLRSTGVGLPYNISTALFSGTTPLISTAVIDWTHSAIAPAGYLVLSALVTIAFVWKIRETARTELRQV